MDFEGYDTVFIIKFLLLWVPFTIMIVMMAPGLKWKLLYPICGAVGIWLALTGKSMRRRN